MSAWMKLLSRWVTVAALLAGSAHAQQPAGNGKALPVGWYVTESAPQLYEASVDTSAPCEGSTRSALLRSRTPNANGYGTFMQAFGAQGFRGKRLRFSANVRTRDVAGWAGLWMRVESTDPKQPLGFDNMQSRALVGTGGCQRHDVVLDVPHEATYITAGLLLSGTGQAWLDGVRFEVVDASVPVTDLLSVHSPVASKPVTLSGKDASAPPRGQLALGRVGFVWFNRDRIQMDPQRHQPQGRSYARQASGVWKNALKEELTEAGGEVKGEFEQRDLRLKVKSAAGPETRIEGTWGDHDVRIVMGVERISMKWGFYERELSRDPEPPEEDPSCIRYKRVEGARVTDQLDVCGAALSKNPPVAQLVAAFLANGFRRMPPANPLPPAPKPPERTDRDAMQGGQSTSNSLPQ